MNFTPSFGLLPSPPDYRDIIYGSSFFNKPLPDLYINDISMLPVWNQNHVPACSGHATGKLRQFQEYKETNNIIPLSARFLYSMAKKVDGLPPTVQGTYFRLPLKIARNYGCATEDAVPNDTFLENGRYIDTSFYGDAIYQNAHQYRAKSYALVGSFMGITEDSLKYAVMDGGALVGISIDYKWWSGLTTDPIPPPHAPSIGHELFFHGFEKRNGDTYFRLLNSWGPSWGKNGVGFIRFKDYEQFLIEAWTIADMPNEIVDHATSLPSADEFNYLFMRDILYGETSPEVRNLQIALKIDGTFPQVQLATGFYGEVTRRAVLAFQDKYHVGSPLERALLGGKRVGPKTRLELNSIFSAQAKVAK